MREASRKKGEGSVNSKTMVLCLCMAYSQVLAAAPAYGQSPLQPPFLISPGGDGAFPDATNTGVPAGITLSPSSSLSISTPGTVIDSKDINGTIFIDANNVTVRRSRLRASGAGYVIRVNFGRTGAVIEDNEVDGLGNSDKCVAGENVTVRRNNIHGCQDGGILWSGSTWEDNYIHDLNCGSICSNAGHFDGVEMDGGNNNVTVRHNTIDQDQWTQTSAVQINNGFGGSSNILIENNLLIGAGYTCYRDANQGSGSLNVTYRNNHLVSCQGSMTSNGCTSKTGWFWGPVLSRGPGTMVWEGNVDHLTGAPISQ